MSLRKISPKVSYFTEKGIKNQVYIVYNVRVLQYVAYTSTRTSNYKLKKSQYNNIP